MNLKKKLSSAIDHVKSHPAFYGYIAGVAVTAIAIAVVQKNDTKKFLNDKQLVDLISSSTRMRELGKGVYFELKDGSGTVAMILEEFLDEPLDRLS